MGFEEIWNEYTSSEKDMFQKSVRRLLKQTFIVRDRDEDSKKAYYFVSKRSEPFSAYLGYIGYDIVIDRENGVIMLQNCRDLGENGKLQINHVTLKKMESVVLCCLWTLYADRVRSGSLSKNIEISVTDLRYEMEKYGIRDQIDKFCIDSDAVYQISASAGDWKARRGGLPDLSLSVDAVCAGTTGVWQICGKCQPADAGKVEP